MASSFNNAWCAPWRFRLPTQSCTQQDLFLGVLDASTAFKTPASSRQTTAAFFLRLLDVLPMVVRVEMTGLTINHQGVKSAPLHS